MNKLLFTIILLFSTVGISENRLIQSGDCYSIGDGSWMWVECLTKEDAVNLMGRIDKHEAEEKRLNELIWEDVND